MLTAFLTSGSSFGMTEDERAEFCNHHLYPRVVVQPYARNVLKHVNHQVPTKPLQFPRNPNSFHVERFTIDFTEKPEGRSSLHSHHQQDLKTFWDGVVSHYLERGLITADEIEKRVLADSDYFHHNSEMILFQEMVPGSEFPEHTGLSERRNVTMNPLAGGRVTLLRKPFEPKNDIRRDLTYIREVDLFYGQGDEAFKATVTEAMKRKQPRLANAALISRVFMSKDLTALERINAYTELIDTALSAIREEDLFRSLVIVFAHTPEHAALWQSWGFETAGESKAGVIALISNTQDLLGNLMKRTRLEADRVTRNLIRQFNERPQLRALPDWMDGRGMIYYHTRGTEEFFGLITRKVNGEWKLECSLGKQPWKKEMQEIAPCIPTFSIIPSTPEEPTMIRIDFDARFKKHRARGFATFYSIDGSVQFTSNYQYIKRTQKYSDGSSTTSTSMGTDHGFEIRSNHEKNYSTNYDSELSFEENDIRFSQSQFLPLREYAVEADEGKFYFDGKLIDEEGFVRGYFDRKLHQHPHHLIDFYRDRVVDRGANIISPLWIQNGYEQVIMSQLNWREVFEILGIKEKKPQK